MHIEASACPVKELAAGLLLRERGFLLCSLFFSYDLDCIFEVDLVVPYNLRNGGPHVISLRVTMLTLARAWRMGMRS